MAFFPSSFTLASVAVIFSLLGIRVSSLSLNYYASSCPQANIIIKFAVISAILNERRMGASLLRLHFHDCFVNGCDASVLLDDDPTTGFIGEKTALPNINSIRGFEVIDEIKAKIEAKCRGIVSCADILAVAARDSVVALGGETYDVPLGRKDSKTANFSGANTDLPPPFGSKLLNTLITFFSRKGFTTQEMVVLSGAHTIGKAHCFLFRDRLYNDTNIDRTYAESLKKNCTRSPSDDNNLSPLDVTTENRFDNAYYANLVNKKGLLSSDQALFNGSSTDSIVTTYKNSPLTFLSDFGKAMVKMGNLSPPSGSQGEIRANCRKRNV